MTHPTTAGTVQYVIPTNTRHLVKAGLMLIRRLRRRPDIQPALSKRLVLLGCDLGEVRHYRQFELYGTVILNLRCRCPVILYEIAGFTLAN